MVSVGGHTYPIRATEFYWALEEVIPKAFPYRAYPETAAVPDELLDVSPFYIVLHNYQKAKNLSDSEAVKGFKEVMGDHLRNNGVFPDTLRVFRLTSTSLLIEELD